MRSRDIDIDKWIEISDSCSDDDNSVPLSINVVGNSMIPLIRSRVDRVFVERTGSSELRLGDIVLIRMKGNGLDYVLHRIWKIKNSAIITLGDGNSKPDAPVSNNDIVGYATELHRGNRIIDLQNERIRKLGCIWLKMRLIHRPVARLYVLAGNVFHRMNGERSE